MRRALSIDIDEVERYYRITEDGLVFSKIKDRWLKPRQNMYGYVFYSICYGIRADKRVIGAFAHTLVALKYIGRPPEGTGEVDHIDGNKANNHVSNLRWVSHSENIRNSFAGGRVGYWKDRVKLSPSLETRMLMSNAKKKRISFTRGDDTVVFESIGEAAEKLGTYRKRVYLCIAEGRPFYGGYLKYVKDGFDDRYSDA